RRSACRSETARQGTSRRLLVCFGDACCVRAAEAVQRGATCAGWRVAGGAGRVGVMRHGLPSSERDGRVVGECDGRLDVLFGDALINACVVDEWPGYVAVVVLVEDAHVD